MCDARDRMAAATFRVRTRCPHGYDRDAGCWFCMGDELRLEREAARKAETAHRRTAPRGTWS